MKPIDEPGRELDPEFLCQMLVYASLIEAYGRLARLARRNKVSALELSRMERTVIENAVTLPAGASPEEVELAERAGAALREAFEKAQVFFASRH